MLIMKRIAETLRIAKATNLEVDMLDILHHDVNTNGESEGHDGHDEVVVPSPNNRNNSVSHGTLSGDNSMENSPIAYTSNVEHVDEAPKDGSGNDEIETVET